MIVMAALAGAIAGGLGGCGADSGGLPMAGGAGTSDSPSATTSDSPPATTSDGGHPGAEQATSMQAAIYAAVLRRYLTTSDHSFGAEHRFPIVYVLNATDASAADPMRAGDPTRHPIGAADQAAIRAALRDVGRVEFVADSAAVVERVADCQQVRGGGVLITLAPPTGDATRVEVGIHGYVACLAATWFTYVVVHESGGWRVTGTTGPMAIA
jgi:hypothetical protein